MKQLTQSIFVLFFIFCVTLFISSCGSDNKLTSAGGMQEIVVDETTPVSSGNNDCATATTFYADADADGYGDGNSTTSACSQPTGYVATADDCDDANAAVNPAATEVCDDGIDNNCDGTVDCVTADIGSTAPYLNPGSTLGGIDGPVTSTGPGPTLGAVGFTLDSKGAASSGNVSPYRSIEYTSGSLWNGFFFNNDSDGDGDAIQDLGSFSSYLPSPYVNDSSLIVIAQASSSFDHNIIYQRAFITEDNKSILVMTGENLKVKFTESGTETRSFCLSTYPGLTTNYTTNYEYVAALLSGIEYSSSSNMGVLEAGVSWSSNTDARLQNIKKITSDDCIDYEVNFTGQDARAIIYLTFIAFNSSDVAYGEKQTPDIYDIPVQNNETLTETYPLHGDPNTWGEPLVLFSGFKNFKLRHSCWDGECFADDPGYGFEIGIGLAWLGLVITDTTLGATQNVSVNIVASETFEEFTYSWHYGDYGYHEHEDPKLVVTAQTLTLGLKPSQHSQTSGSISTTDGTTTGTTHVNCGLDGGVWTCE